MSDTVLFLTVTRMLGDSAERLKLLAGKEITEASQYQATLAELFKLRGMRFMAENAVGRMEPACLNESLEHVLLYAANVDKIYAEALDDISLNDLVSRENDEEGNQ